MGRVIHLYANNSRYGCGFTQIVTIRGRNSNRIVMRPYRASDGPLACRRPESVAATDGKPGHAQTTSDVPPTPDSVRLAITKQLGPPIWVDVARALAGSTEGSPLNGTRA